MSTTQNLTKSQSVTDKNEEVVQQRKHAWALDHYITFCASSGLAMDEDGEIRPTSITEFAAAVGVARGTLYWWQKNVPGFWQLVDKRAKEIFNHQTKYAIIKGLKLKAMAGDVRAAEMIWSHFGDYTPPAQKHEVKLNGWGDVVREARKKKIRAERVIDAPEAQTTPAMAAASPPATAAQPSYAAPPANDPTPAPSNVNQAEPRPTGQPIPNSGRIYAAPGI